MDPDHDNIDQVDDFEVDMEENESNTRGRVTKASSKDESTTQRKSPLRKKLALHNRTKSDYLANDKIKLEQSLDVALATIQQLQAIGGQDQLVRVNSDLEYTAEAKANMTRQYMDALQRIEELEGTQNDVPSNVVEQFNVLEQDTKRLASLHEEDSAVIEKLQQQILKFRNELEKKDKRIETLSQDVSQEKKLVSTSSATVKVMESTIQNLSEEKDQLSAKNQQLMIEISKTEEQLTSTQVIQELEEKLSLRTSQLHQSIRCLKQSKTVVSQVKGSLRSSKQLCQKYQDGFESLKIQLEKQLRQFVSASKSKDKTIKLEQQISSLKATRVRNNEIKRNLEQQMTEKERHIARLENQMSDVKRQFDLIKSMQSNAVSDLQEKKCGVSKLQHDLRRLKQLYADSKTETKNLKSQIEVLNQARAREFDSSISQIKRIRRQSSCLDITKDEFDTHDMNAMLKAYQEEYQLRVDDLLKQLNESKSQNEHLENQKRALEIENRVAIQSLLDKP